MSHFKFPLLFLLTICMFVSLNLSAKELGQATAWRGIDEVPAGIAGDQELVFVGAPLEARVLVYQRNSRVLVGELPAPVMGFLVPFIIKHIGHCRIAVLDAGGLPAINPYSPSYPKIYEYEYHFDSVTGFNAQLVRTVSFDSVEIGFAEDFVQMKDKSYLLSDAVLGALWSGTTKHDGTSVVRPVIVPKSKAARDQIPQLVMRPNMPVIQVDQIPFLFSGSAIPGIGAMAIRFNQLYFASSATGVVYRIPLASLNDRRHPWERAADIRVVSTKAKNVEVEELLGLSFDPLNANSPYLYAVDPLQLRVIRINVHTGKRQVVSSTAQQGGSSLLFNFPSSLSFLPPSTDGEESAAIFVVSNQQHRTPLTNDAIQDEIFQKPFVITQIQLH
jgi:hypothetical protein